MEPVVPYGRTILTTECLKKEYNGEYPVPLFLTIYNDNLLSQEAMVKTTARTFVYKINLMQLQMIIFIFVHDYSSDTALFTLTIQLINHFWHHWSCANDIGVFKKGI
jgi:hypothetical protein